MPMIAVTNTVQPMPCLVMGTLAPARPGEHDIFTLRKIFTRVQFVQRMDLGGCAGKPCRCRTTTSAPTRRAVLWSRTYAGPQHRHAMTCDRRSPGCCQISTVCSFQRPHWNPQDADDALTGLHTRMPVPAQAHARSWRGAHPEDDHDLGVRNHLLDSGRDGGVEQVLG